MKIKNNTVDIIALSSSLLCAIHCAAPAILLSFTSFSSIAFLGNPYIEWTFILLGIVFVFVSLWPSYKRVHHNLKPLRYVVIGFILIAIGRLHLTEYWEVTHTVLGACLIAFAHYINWKLLKQCSKHHT